MSLLFKIIYAAHANGTHHKLALDALRELKVDQAEDWRRLFLKNAELFLEGSKAPDKEFKDFKNHVLHPGDDYWGGAPEKVRNWYNHTVQALGSYNWSEAAYCAGVMSHYYTDPIHPFHTAQSKAENAIHRAVEWSINKSYNALRREALTKDQSTRDLSDWPEIADGETWIEDFVCSGADRSHQDYERLIAHYDFTRGSVIPETGLDPVGRETVGALLLYASSGFAQLLGRAIMDARVVPPQVNLTADTVVASLKIPSKWVLRKMDDAEDRKLVQAMFDELQKTGDVAKTLPEDDRAIRDLHEREVMSKRREQRKTARKHRFESSRKKQAAPSASRHTLANVAPERAAPPPEANTDLARLDLSANSTRQTAPENVPPLPAPAATAPTVVNISEQPRAAQKDNRSLRFYIEKDSPVVDAPSVGAKTAERLAPAGIATINDLLTCDPETVAATVAMRHITPTAIRNWQDQTRLALTIPELRGTHAQLLVGAGFRSAEAIANASVEDVCAGVLDYAQSSEGQRLLRDGAAPDIEKIKTWTE
ncbi:MAG: DUF4332 domain-containing protein, partial [Pseudomonadota bacterium]